MKILLHIIIVPIAIILTVGIVLVTCAGVMLTSGGGHIPQQYQNQNQR